MNGDKLKKTGKGALIAAAGAALAYLVDALPGLDLGHFALIAGATLSTLVNLVHQASKPE